MRDLFIRSMEWIVNIFITLGAIAVVVSGLVVMFSDQGGFLRGLAVLFGGAIYLIVVGGIIYLGLGIYNNTRRTAEAVEALVSRRPPELPPARLARLSPSSETLQGSRWAGRHPPSDRRRGARQYDHIRRPPCLKRAASGGRSEAKQEGGRRCGRI